MKLIPLTRGMFAMVDDADFEWLNQWRWFAWRPTDRNTWYAKRSGCIDGKKNSALHRVILGEHIPKIDHRDGNGLNNQRLNLRPCSTKGNSANHQIRVDNSSGFTGVSLYRDGRWMARICVDQKSLFLGYFVNKLDAALAYNVAAVKHFGEFARLNNI